MAGGTASAAGPVEVREPPGADDIGLPAEFEVSPVGVPVGSSVSDAEGLGEPDFRLFCS